MLHLMVLPLIQKIQKNLIKITSQNFKILKTISAGDNPKVNKVKKYETVEVMTGALIPKNLTQIIPIEKIIFNTNNKYININNKIKKNQHIRYAGSDYKKKDLIIKLRIIIQPSHILAFKTLGITKLKLKKNLIFYFFQQEMKFQIIKI